MCVHVRVCVYVTLCDNVYVCDSVHVCMCVCVSVRVHVYEYVCVCVADQHVYFAGAVQENPFIILHNYATQSLSSMPIKGLPSQANYSISYDMTSLFAMSIRGGWGGGG